MLANGGFYLFLSCIIDVYKLTMQFVQFLFETVLNYVPKMIVSFIYNSFFTKNFLCYLLLMRQVCLTNANNVSLSQYQGSTGPIFHIDKQFGKFILQIDSFNQLLITYTFNAMVLAMKQVSS